MRAGPVPYVGAVRTDTVLERPADLTVEWLTEVLQAGRVTEFRYDRIGTGQMSECYRVEVTYAPGDTGPASIVLKVAAGDPTSRQTGLALGLYEREVRFYTDIAPRLTAAGAGPVAPCHHGAINSETGVFDLVLGDASPAVVGDEIRGATTEQALLAVAELGRLHAPLLGDPTLAGADWLNRDAPVTGALLSGLYAGFTDRYGEAMTSDQRTVCDRLVAGFDDYLAAEGAPDRPMGLVHGDYRLDNLLFGGPGADRPVTVVDWQTVTWGPALTDLAYFLGCALPVAARREHHDALLRAYHDALGADTALTLDAIREGVRRQSFFGVMMAIVSAMLVVRTERGDEMFLTMLERHCAHVLDTEALATLPAPSGTAPLQPAAADEGAHPAGPEPLWNESWYFDFVDAAQGIGGWIRLGLMPNENVAWVQALLCGPDMPTIAVSDFEVPLPADPFRVLTGDGTVLTHAATVPLQRCAVTVRGRAQAYDDPAALLRGEPGRDVAAVFDLEWATDGVPYQYRIASRYEIPCTVSGTVVADGRSFTIDEVPGQRDHSWGARDWWGMEWVWSAVHLDDGTHVHGVDLRIPGLPPMGVGYVQGGGELTELELVTAREVFGDGISGDKDLPVSTELSLAPGDLVVDTVMVGQAPVRLVAPDGRVSHFPRAWATVTTGDGRRGVGWLEWNRNQ